MKQFTKADARTTALEYLTELYKNDPAAAGLFIGEARREGMKETLTLADAYAEFLTHPDFKKRAQATEDRRLNTWVAFVEWAKDEGLTHFASVTVDDARSFIVAQQSKGLLASSINLTHAAVSQVFKMLAKRYGIDNPFDIPKLDEDSSLREKLSTDEVQRLIIAGGGNVLDTKIGNWENKGEPILGGEVSMLIKVGLFTGLRLADCIALKYSDYNQQRKAFVVMPRKTRRLKKRVEIPVLPEFEKELKAWNKTATVGEPSTLR